LIKVLKSLERFSRPVACEDVSLVENLAQMLVLSEGLAEHQEMVYNDLDSKDDLLVEGLVHEHW